MSWETFALCRGHANCNLWFSDEKASRDRAKEVCADCPVKEPCLAGAVERNEHFGIWGGRDVGASERHKKYRERVKLQSRQVA